MDFDEYDYLEKTVENPDLGKEAGRTNGDGSKSDERHRSRSSRHGGGDRDADGDGRSKRAKVEDDGRGLSSHRRGSPERASRDGRDRNRSGGERREREKGGREKERGREREREKDRDKERDRDRENERGRDREKVRERDKEMEKPREKEREERVKERERERPGRSKSQEVKEKDKEVVKEVRERDRDGRRHKEKKDDAEPEADPERDQRTVFAYQISLKADERDVYEFFSRAGKVRDVRLIMDRNSRRSKGVGYIEFYDVMSVPMAIALSGQLLLGQPVMVKPSEAEKNLVQSTTAASAGAGARKLYVGNLHFSITEEQLRQVFEPFGTVELVQLPLDPETGQCKGFGFVQFARLEDAKAAQSLNGQLDIAGRIIKVSAVTDQVGMQEVGANAADFDDDDGGGLSLNARSRAILMQKLDRTGTATSIVGSLGNPVVANGTGNPLSVAPALGTAATATPLLPGLGQTSVPAFGVSPGSVLATGSVGIPQTSPVVIPTECLLLTNMFDPRIESEPDFDLDIKDDVQDECSKFGTVKHIFVDKNSDGHVYLRFDAATSAFGAQRALHGRWFAGKQISATFMLPQNYEAKFPDSK